MNYQSQYNLRDYQNHHKKNQEVQQSPKRLKANYSINCKK